MWYDDREPVKGSDGVTGRPSGPGPTWGMLPRGEVAADGGTGLAVGETLPVRPGGGGGWTAPGGAGLDALLILGS